MVKLIRSERPRTCEMWVKDKITGMIGRCTNKIVFINKSSGGFLCIKCANMLHKRYSGKYIKLFDAKKYLNKWYPIKAKSMKEWRIVYKKADNEYKAVNIKAKTLDEALNKCDEKYGKPCTTGIHSPKQISIK